MPDIAALANSNFGGVSTETSAQRDAASLANDFDDFLVLLTTQLQNQDPLDPMDSGEFTNQLVAFAGVEQQIKTNDNLEILSLITSLNNSSAAVSYLGQQALVASPFGSHDTDGIHWQYAHDDVPDEAIIEVLDEEGNVVYTQEGEVTLGTHDFKWNGMTNGGTLAAPGTYEISINTTKEDGDNVATGVAVFGNIEGVESIGTEPHFTVGPNIVAQSSILQVLAQN